MSTIKNGLNRVVRSDSAWWSRVVLCVLAFLATAAAVSWMGTKKAHPPTRYIATATIQHRLAPPDQAIHDTHSELPRLDAATSRRQVLSDENLRHALRRLGPRGSGITQGDLLGTGEQTLEKVRRNLRVTTDETSSPEGLRISISCTDEDPDRVVGLVNALAERYAEEHRAKLASTAGRKSLEAQEAAEHARQEFFKAQTQFDDFLERHFLRVKTLADRAADRPANRPAAPRSAAGLPPGRPAEPASPWTTGNPEKVDLARQLAVLEQRRAQLLMDRTPLHPEVQDIELRITRVKERLASIPDQVPGQWSGGSPPNEEPATRPQGVEPISTLADEVCLAEILQQDAEAVRAFHAHKEALAEARGHYDRLAEAKRRAWEEQLHGANVELELAETCEVSQSADGSPPRLLVALGAALAVALGVGMISSGFDTDLPLNTPDQAKTALPVPIVGRIPVIGPPSTGNAQPGSALAGGPAKVIYGVLLIAVCFGILVVVF